jgi:low temperature requirement protein LtrA
MSASDAPKGLLRARHGHEHGKVTFVELFFDLVFVFAVTQLSHSLLKDLSMAGAAKTGFLLMAVWWAWIYTSWVTNWLDPERTPVRLLLMVLMLVGLVLSMSIPTAFGVRGLSFALAYVALQVGRSLFTLWAVRRHARNRRNFQRITAWLALAAGVWIGGGVAGGALQVALWIVALGIEYLSPALGFWTPGLGRSTTADWDVEGGHIAERCALFVIIALGESILVTGATFGDMRWSADTAAAFAVDFVGSVAMWWLYFDTGAGRGSREIAASADPGRLARLAYTYIHLLLVGGIIIAAVADEIVLAHPSGHVEPESLAVILGGPAVYIVGNILFKRATANRIPLSHLVGCLLLIGLVPVGIVASPLTLGAGAAAALVVVAVWETVSLRRGRPMTATEIG